jgi:hypothetical protein
MIGNATSKPPYCAGCGCDKRTTTCSCVEISLATERREVTPEFLSRVADFLSAAPRNSAERRAARRGQR